MIKLSNFGGFDSGKGLFPGSVKGAVIHHIVREFSILPEKFLFLDLHGWEEWRDRGEEGRFEVRFELERPPFTFEKVTKEDFTFFAAPAVNVFPHRARPVILREEGTEHPINPQGKNPRHFAVYSIERVAGIIEGSAEKVPFASTGSLSGSYSTPNPVYHEMRSESLHGYNTSISVKLPSSTAPRNISSLSAKLLCTNGILPESLCVGDICELTEKSLNFVTFTNCTPVTSPLFDTLGGCGSGQGLEAKVQTAACRVRGRQGYALRCQPSADAWRRNRVYRSPPVTKK